MPLGPYREGQYNHRSAPAQTPFLHVWALCGARPGPTPPVVGGGRGVYRGARLSSLVALELRCVTIVHRRARSYRDAGHREGRGMRQRKGSAQAPAKVMKAGRCFLLTVGVLVVFTVARGYGLLGPPVVTVAVLMGALVLVAWSTGATLADLGLGRGDVGAGLRYGAGAFGLVLLVLIVAAVIPA